MCEGGAHAMYERGEHVCGVEALNSSPLKDTSGWMPVLKVFPSPPLTPSLSRVPFTSEGPSWDRSSSPAPTMSARVP